MGVKVFYRLPDIDEFGVLNRISNGAPMLTDKDMQMFVIKEHQDILRPILTWILDTLKETDTVPSIKCKRLYTTNTIICGVEFNMIESDAMLFKLKYGDRYNG